jgi:hypothetical protein
MINTVRNGIKTLLDTLSDIKEIYNHPENNPSGYPYAWITWEGNESQELSNREDRVTMIFRVTLVQEKLEELKGRTQAELTSMDRAWQIEELFRKNNDLGLAGVLRVLPVETKKEYDASATRIILSTTLKVQVVSEVTL